MTMLKRNILNSPKLLELKKHRRNVFLVKILFCIFVLVALFALSAYISGLKELNISGVEVTGNKVVSTETIKSIIGEKITGNYLFFFPRTNILIYPKKEIEKGISDQFKRINKINFAIKGNNKLEVSVTERTALYTWCGNTPPQPDSKEKEVCYFLDDSGYLFDEAPYFSGEVYFKFYGSINSGDKAPLGIYFAPQNFSKLVSFKNILESMGLKSITLYIEEDGDVRIILSNKASTGPEIIFKLDASLETVAENLQAALSTEPLLSNFKNKYSSLEYIDLRFGNKVYYKFR